jgi:hypothetical protein
MLENKNLVKEEELNKLRELLEQLPPEKLSEIYALLVGVTIGAQIKDDKQSA